MKRKVLLIVNHRKNRSPGQRFRFEQYLSFLEENGFEFTFSNIISEADDAIFYAKGKYFGKAIILIKSFLIRFYDCLRASNYDIVFVFREASFLGISFFEKLLSKSKAKLIFDFDDAIWLSEVSTGNKSLAFLKNPNKTRDIIKVVDMVFTGNRYLANYALKFNSHVEVVPTTIDTSYHVKKNIQKSSDKICIGWTGTDTTAKHFEYLVPTLEKIYAKYSNVYFKMICDRDIDYPSINLRSSKWNKEQEIEQLSEIDIGIMPLPDDEWAQGKCGFKGLQYMSLGIPTIMSPVGVNNDIIIQGENGFLAADEAAWLEKLSLFIEDADLRHRLGSAGRKTIENRYSVNAWKQEYLRLFRILTDN